MKLKLDLVEYDDSLFTNAHTLVSHETPTDGRGSFTHLGVKMDGLESQRHLNFSASEQNMLFTRSNSVRNHVKLKPFKPCRIESIEFDTTYYTRNNVQIVYKVIFELDNGSIYVPISKERLEGDSVKKFVIPNFNGAVMRIELELSEGGLTRFNAYGDYANVLLQQAIDLTNAQVFGSSDQSYGDASLALRSQREGFCMRGWETTRHSLRQRLGIRLNEPHSIGRIEIDTYLHSLNSFKYICVLGCNVNASTEELISGLPKWNVVDGSGRSHLISDDQLNEHELVRDFSNDVSYNLSQDPGLWTVLVPWSKCRRDTLNCYNVKEQQEVQSIMLYGVPDGGIHRIVLYSAM